MRMIYNFFLGSASYLVSWLTAPLFLLQVLAVTVRFIQRDADEKKMIFNPRPYFRLFINWLVDLSSLDPVFDGANFQVFFFFLLYMFMTRSSITKLISSGAFQVLTALANAFHALQPLKVPGFRYIVSGMVE